MGNHFSDSQQGGLAIVSISDPENPLLLDLFKVPGASSGGGIVKKEGDRVYLGAMKDGLVILDISEPSDIQFISQYIPDINYPVSNPNPDLYNARGMVVKDQIIYLCYDAGGLRIIDCTNPELPEEIGRFSNPALHDPINLPRAYNNIVLDGDLVYVTVDYCGIEVLDISDPENVAMVGWWNPQGCPDNNWFTSPIHTNEVVLDRGNKLLYTSAGSSDMIVVDVSDPTQPDSCNAIGSEGDRKGTWGVAAFKDKIFLTYICAVVPFFSTEAYVSIIECENCNTVSVKKDEIELVVKIFPNPVSDQFTVITPVDRIELYDIHGALVKTYSGIPNSATNYDVSYLQPGIYIISLLYHNAYSIQKLIKI